MWQQKFNIEKIKRLEDLKIEIQKIKNKLYAIEYDQLQHNILPTIETEFRNFCKSQGFVEDNSLGNSKSFNPITGENINCYMYRYNDFIIQLSFVSNNNKKEDTENNFTYKKVELIVGYKTAPIVSTIQIFNKQLESIEETEIGNSLNESETQQYINIKENDLNKFNKYKNYKEFDFEYRTTLEDSIEFQNQNISENSFRNILKRIF